MLDMKQFDDALRNLNRALELSASDKDVLAAKARVYEAMENLEEAKYWYQKALDIGEDSELLSGYGLVLAKIGDHHGASETFGKLASVNPEDKEAWYNSGLALEKLKDYEGALLAYDKTIGLDAEDKFAWNSKGLVLLELEKHENALRCFERALAIDPDFASSKDGIRIAKERLDAQEIEVHARAVLHTEYERNRPVSREEAFRDAGVPYSHIESVFNFLNKIEDIPIQVLSDQELEELEDASKDVLVRCLGSGSPVQRTKLRLSDIAAQFPDYSLWKAKRVLGYIQRIDTLTFPPESNQEMEALLHRALDLPPERRMVLGLVESLDLGVMKAKQLQSLLATFRGDGYVAPEVEIGSLVSDEYAKPTVSPKQAQQKKPAPKPKAQAGALPAGDVDPKLAGKHCQTHGHLAVFRHNCGAYLCHNCISGAKKCPICRQPLQGKASARPAPERAPEELPVEELEEERHERSDNDVKSEYSQL